MNSRIKRNKNLEKSLKKETKIKKRKNSKKGIKKFFIVIIVLIAIFLLYARFIEPNILLTHEIKVSTNLISKSYHGLKIVHFSDLHYGSTVKKYMMEKLVKEINILKPDIVIFTGDLIEDDYNISNEEISYLTKKLSSIKTTYGKYAVIGNHDFYNSNFSNIMYDSNFNCLVNDYDIIYNYNNDKILIYGLDDIIYGKPNLDMLNDPNIKDIPYKIIIVHEPDYATDITSDYNVNLILAGHSHNKQVNIPYVPDFILPPGAKTYYKPYYLINDTKLYISNGIGTSGIKLRAFTPPSINFYRIVKD